MALLLQVADTQHHLLHLCLPSVKQGWRLQTDGEVRRSSWQALLGLTSPRNAVCMTCGYDVRIVSRYVDCAAVPDAEDNGKASTSGQSLDSAVKVNSVVLVLLAHAGVSCVARLPCEHLRDTAQQLHMCLLACMADVMAPLNVRRLCLHVRGRNS